MPSSFGNASSFSNPSTDAYSPPLTETIAEGCISFTVFCTSISDMDEQEITLVLAIPKLDISRLSLRPYKWLQYIGFAILGLPGFLSAAKAGPPLPETTMNGTELDENLASLWYIHGAENFTLRHSVNPAILARRHVISTTSSHAPHFKTDLRSAQGSQCPFTCVPNMRCEARHVIAFSRTAKCLVNILLARQVPATDPIFDMIEQNGINAVPNGYLIERGLHNFLDSGHVAILRTPNQYMDTEDVAPSRQARLHDRSLGLRPAAVDPKYRYTLQALDAETDDAFSELPSEGIFPNTIPDHYLPHGALLDWAYGSAAIQMWTVGSHGRKLLESHPDAIRPPPLTASAQEQGQPRATCTLAAKPRITGWDVMEYISSLVHPAGQNQLQHIAIEAEREHVERIEAWIQTSSSGAEAE